MKKLTKWKSFDFGPETSVNETKSPPKKQKSLDSNCFTTITPKPIGNSKKTVFDFHKKIEPKRPSDLIVHAKKVQEIEGWLKSVMEARERKKTEFMLLTGPAGSGKASTVQVLCKSLNIEITEWTNPVDIDYEIFKGSSQVKKFLEFFYEAKYCSLVGHGNNKKVLVVKDFPNALIRSPGDFYNILEEIFYKATHPVIFICTDLSSGAINLQRSLFPEEVLLKYSIAHFSFNACAATLLKKGLKRAVDVLLAFPDLFRAPSQHVIDAILASSMGDIRCAMNQLYLACVIGNQELHIVKSKSDKTGSKRKRNGQAGTIKHMARDETLGLFHGLGRVLNPKRREEGVSWRLNCDVQKLVDEFSIQPSMFTSFLFENYLKYFGHLKDADKSADILSCSTRLLDNWDNHDTLVMALWIAVLGLMVFNDHKASKWNQIKGPRKVTKISYFEEGVTLHPTDRFYYNMITKTEKYHKYNCDF